jgi:hypothetical protein
VRAHRGGVGGERRREGGGDGGCHRHAVGCRNFVVGVCGVEMRRELRGKGEARERETPEVLSWTHEIWLLLVRGG